jgi:glycosyltransferase involved in cell wall biosynthesis
MIFCQTLVVKHLTSNIKDIKVDILMATYNGEKFLPEQLESILNQTHQNFRLIISDDGSTDGTRDILEYYADNDARIEVHFNKQNVGVIKNFERLLSFSSSPYFMLCDQDDVWATSKVSELLEKIHQDNLNMVFSDLMIVDERLEVRFPSFFKLQNISSQIENNLWKILLFQNIVSGCSLIARGEMKKYILPFPEKVVMHDWWISFVCSINGKIGIIEEPLMLYRQHEKNLVGYRKIKKNEFDSYNIFVAERDEYLANQMEYFVHCLRSLVIQNNPNNNEAISLLNKVTAFYSKIRKVKYINFNLFDYFFKCFYPSMGIKRNLWWTIYYNSPIIAFVLKRTKNSM